MRFVYELAALLLAIALIRPNPATAQVNIEALRTLMEGFAFSLTTNFALRSGNNEKYEIGTASRLDYRHGDHYAFVLGNLEYGQKDGKAFENKVFGHFRYARRLSERLSLETFTQAEHDGFTLLRIRFLVGLGARLRYVATEQVGFFQGTALMAERERLDQAKVSVHPASSSVVRWSNYLNLRVHPSDRFSLVHTIYVQPRVDRFADLRLLNETVLNMPLSDHIAFLTTLSVRYDSEPPDAIESTDLEVTQAVRLSF
jgi:putative salt-induced outer membrane protein YdiY